MSESVYREKYREGYQDALDDVLTAFVVGDTEGVLLWLARELKAEDRKEQATSLYHRKKGKG